MNLDLLFIFGAQYVYLIALAVSIYFFLKLRKSDKIGIMIFGFCTLTITYLFVLIAGHLYYDPRPFVLTHIAPLIPHDPDNGFPSDHTVLLSSVAGSFLLFNKKALSILFGFALFVGVSRIYVGIHHPVDIIGSIAIACMSTACTAIIYRKYILRKVSQQVAS